MCGLAREEPRNSRPSVGLVDSNSSVLSFPVLLSPSQCFLVFFEECQDIWHVTYSSVVNESFCFRCWEGHFVYLKSGLLQTKGVEWCKEFHHCRRRLSCFPLLSFTLRLVEFCWWRSQCWQSCELLSRIAQPFFGQKEVLEPSGAYSVQTRSSSFLQSSRASSDSEKHDRVLGLRNHFGHVFTRIWHEHTI